DSNGGGGLITNGDTQWMTAGGGILHIEAPPEELVISGGLFHGFQLWVNLPARMKMTNPRYQDIRAGEVALLSSPDGGTLVRVIAGEVAGHPGPGVTHTPIALLHATLQPGAQLRLPWRPDFNALGYVLAGSGSVGADQRPAATGQLAVFGPGGAITLSAARRARGPGRGRGRARARRPADQGAGRRVRPVRDEHQGRAGAGVRGLPGRPARLDPRAAADAPGRQPPRPRRPLSWARRPESAPRLTPRLTRAGPRRGSSRSRPRGRV